MMTHTATATTVTFVDGSVGGAVEAAGQLSGSEESITTGHAHCTGMLRRYIRGQIIIRYNVEAVKRQVAGWCDEKVSVCSQHISAKCLYMERCMIIYNYLYIH